MCTIIKEEKYRCFWICVCAAASNLTGVDWSSSMVSRDLSSVMGGLFGWKSNLRKTDQQANDTSKWKIHNFLHNSSPQSLTTIRSLNRNVIYRSLSRVAFRDFWVGLEFKGTQSTHEKWSKHWSNLKEILNFRAIIPSVSSLI